MLWLALHFPQLRSQARARGHALPEAEREALAAIATWLGRFTPSVSLEPPQDVVAEVQGSLRLLGGVERLEKEVRCGLEELGFAAALALAPTGKLLFSTDAYSVPDIFWIAARWGRWGLGTVLGEMVGLGALAGDEARDIARHILGGNAARLYGLPWPLAA